MTATQTCDNNGCKKKIKRNFKQNNKTKKR